ncbi:uncharacterized protein LOC107843662 [Capsicum annuum]|uniref:uncharacterized protein LOC107843662 n=1 Tax=Capsicum annuum TaxID=4072 RepID=UPI001FB118D7|nr:uncharacterized protein LOC107843662 [Capsicum annuum]
MSCTAVDDQFSGDVDECERQAAEALACLSAGEIEICAGADADADAHIRERRKARKSEDEQEIAVQSEYESELKTRLVLDLNYTPVTSRKSIQELTEEEKEERRLRRVLANRESARRTVRRRQAMLAELKRNAADLALENENLKKKKELASAEYNYLMNKNNNLRMQIAKVVKAEVEETNDDSKSTPTSTTSPTFLHNHSPKVPLVLSTVFPPFDGVVLQGGWRSISDITPQMPTSLGGFKTSDELESSVMMNNNTGNPLYIVSFPCQMQFHAQSNPFHTWPSSYPNDEHTSSLAHECSSSTSKTTVKMENHGKATSLKVETETLDSTDAMPRNFLHEAERDFLSGFRSKGLVKVASTSNPFVLPVLARQNESTRERITCYNNASTDATIEACRKRNMLTK